MPNTLAVSGRRNLGMSAPIPKGSLRPLATYVEQRARYPVPLVFIWLASLALGSAARRAKRGQHQQLGAFWLLQQRRCVVRLPMAVASPVSAGVG